MFALNGVFGHSVMFLVVMVSLTDHAFVIQQNIFNGVLVILLISDTVLKQLLAKVLLPIYYDVRLV